MNPPLTTRSVEMKYNRLWMWITIQSLGIELVGVGGEVFSNQATKEWIEIEGYDVLSLRKVNLPLMTSNV